MAEMNVSMSLTLADAASGPLRAFAEGLAQLKVSAQGVSTNLEKIAASIGNIGKAAAGATSLDAFAASLNALAPAMARVRAEGAATATSLNNIGSRASAGVRGTYALEQAMAALGGTLSRGIAGMTAAAAALGQIGQAGRQAGQGVAAGTNAMGAGLGTANTQASTLMTTLKGLGQLYAAMKIEKGLKASAEDAIEYQNTQTRLKNMNVGAEGELQLRNAADATSRAVPQFSKNQTLEMGIDLRNATGSIEHAIGMLTPFAVAAYDMKMATPAGQTFNDRDMLLIAKALEQRNATMDPAKMQAELDMMTKIYAATQGRVDAQQMLGNLQYSKGGLGQSMDLSFLPMLAAMIEQIKSGGGNGGQIGTALTSLQQSVLNGTGNGQAQKERARLGLIAPPVWNSQGNVDQQKSDLRMAGAEQFQRNPYEWVQNILKPALVRAGIDLTNDAAVNQTLNKLFPNRNAANIVSTMVNRGALLEKDASNINATADSRQQYENNIKTAQANMDAFKAQLANLAIVLGATLLPAITTVAKAFTTLFQGMADFFSAHPIAATLFTWSAALLGVTLAVAGFIKVFGVAGSVVGLLLGNLGTLPAALSVVGAAFNTFAGIVGLAFQRMMPLVAAAMAGFAVGTWVAQLEVGGREVQMWAADLIEWVVDAFKAGWQKIGQIVSSIIPGAHAAGVEGAQGPGLDPSDMRGGYVAGTVKGLGANRIDFGRGDGWDNGGGAIDFGKGKGWGGDAPTKGMFDPSESPGATGRAGGRAAKPKINTDFRDPLGDFIQGIDDAAAAKTLALDKSKIDLERELLMTQGQRHAAEMLHIQEEIEKNIQAQLARTDGKAITQKEANAMRARAQAARDYAEQYTQIAVVQEAYSNKLAAVEDQERNGTLSQTSAEEQKLALRKQEADDLDVIIAKLRALAVAKGDDKAVADLDKLSAKDRTAKGQFSPETVQMLKATQSGFEQMFSSVLNGSMSAGKAIEQFMQGLKKSFLDIISKKLGDALFDSLFGSSKGGGGGGLLSMFSGLFGGGGSGGAMGTASMAGGSGFGDFNATGDLAHLAVGTDYVPRDMLAMIHRGERVMPARDNAAFSAAAAMRGNSGPTSMQLSIHPDAANMMLRDWFEGEMARTMATR